MARLTTSHEAIVFTWKVGGVDFKALMEFLDWKEILDLTRERDKGTLSVFTVEVVEIDRESVGLPREVTR